MAHRRSAVAAILGFLIAASIAVPAFAQQGEIPSCLQPPSNVRGDDALIRLFMSFVARSATMRRQCAAIAGAPHVRVVLRVASRPPTFSRAVSTITRYEAGLVRVAIEIPVAADVAELLAHELEHVVEVIEGLDLPSLAKVRGSGVTELEKGVYETAEAKRMGRLASDEINDKVAEWVDVTP
ncbi:MAG: hypothetical protein ACRD3G_05000 [Vicinamibacterales bacterium]